MSQRPHRCRTWAPRGQTPVLQYNFNWKTLSVAAGLTVWNFYFRLYPGSMKKAQVRDFLQTLVRHLPGPLLLLWDRLPGHRSRLSTDYIASLQGWIHQEYLPSYAQKMNPVEFIWAHWEQVRATQRLPQRLLPAQSSGAADSATHAPPPAIDHRLLATGFFVVRMTLYYARFNSTLPDIERDCACPTGGRVCGQAARLAVIHLR